MATVYCGLPADTLDESKAVAVKVLGREVFHDSDFRERFRREVNAYRKLQHPNIVALYDWGEQEAGMIYIVLELVDGQTLRDVLKTGTPSRTRAREILQELFAATHYAHQRGIVHRDLKPENVMITRQGALKIMDFGLARHHDAEALTQTGSVLGTPAYMAPEQLTRGSVDGRLDQFALGVITYELLSGHLPYPADGDLMALLSDILNTPAPALGIHPELDAVVAKMLSKQPEDRFADVAAAWKALSAALLRC
jgi:eukaryotic-like serine/threonine-protein kinase